MHIAREEIFGPVMNVPVFDDENDAIARASASKPRIAAGVVSISGLRTGTCWINHYNVTPIGLPAGGVTLIRLGRKNGHAAVEHDATLESAYVALADIDSRYR